MKILHIIWSLFSGGAENMLVDILNHQVKSNDIELVVINNDMDPSLLNRIDNRVKIHLLKRPQNSVSLVPFIQLNKIFISSNAAVVHCHSSNIVKLLMSRKLPFIKRKFALTVHNVDRPCGEIKQYDYVFSISESVNKDIKKRYNTESIVNHNGIPVHQIKPRKSTAHVDSVPFKIVQVGSLHHTVKGQDILIHALHHLIHDLDCKNIFIDFIGSGKSQSYLESLIRKYSLEQYARLLGPKERPYIFHHLQDYNLLVQPSRTEGFGLTVAEAMVALIPVLVSDIEGPVEIVQGGKFGTLFKSDDHWDLARKIIWIIKNYNSEEFQTKILKAGLFATDSFNISRTADNYTAHYLS